MPDPLDQFGFSIEQVCSLAGLSKRQLFYWDNTGFFSPEFDSGGRRVYSFRDLVALRTIAKLRERVPLQELRKIGVWLHKKHDTPWASLRFYLAGRTVHFRDPATQSLVAAKPEGQLVCIEMQEIVNETRALVNTRRRRDKRQLGRIEKHRGVARNAPVLAGTRIPAQAVWNFHEAGYETDAILKEYPSLTPKDVRAAINFVRRGRRAS